MIRCWAHAAVRAALAALLGGCALAVRPAVPRADVADNGDAAAAEPGACPSALTCWQPGHGSVPLAVRKACRVDGDCVVVAFQAGITGTREFVGVATDGVADFVRARAVCSNSGGVGPGPAFYEADGGAVERGQDAMPVARCRGGCCVAVPAD